MISNKDVRGVCKALDRVYEGTGFVVFPLGRFTPLEGGEYNRVRIRHSDPDRLHWKEIVSLELTPSDTVATLMARCREAIEATRTRWKWERFKAEQRLLRAGRTQGEA